jgi:hypothetical protein
MKRRALTCGRTVDHTERLMRRAALSGCLEIENSSRIARLILSAHAHGRGVVVTCGDAGIPTAVDGAISASETANGFCNSPRCAGGPARPGQAQARREGGLVGLDGLEPSASSLSGRRSNRTELQAHEYQTLVKVTASGEPVRNGVPRYRSRPVPAGVVWSRSRRPLWSRPRAALVAGRRGTLCGLRAVAMAAGRERGPLCRTTAVPGVPACRTTAVPGVPACRTTAAPRGPPCLAYRRAVRCGLCVPTRRRTTSVGLSQGYLDAADQVGGDVVEDRANRR